jgi:hypothetical protein
MPQAVLTYTLTADDLAAHLATARAAVRRRWQSLFSAAFASIMALNFLAGKLPMPENPLLELAEMAVILAGPAALALWLLRRDNRSQAAELLPAPVEVRLDIYANHALEHRPDLTAPRRHRARTAQRIMATRRLFFLDSETASLVVPARAFADRAELTALADRWRGEMR